VADGYRFLAGRKWWVVIFNPAAMVSLAMATDLIAQGIGAFEKRWMNASSSGPSRPSPDGVATAHQQNRISKSRSLAHRFVEYRLPRFDPVAVLLATSSRHERLNRRHV
jgi:hypothetical protein